VDPRASLDDVEKDNSLPYRGSNSDPSVVHPVASRYSDYAILAPLHVGIVRTIIKNTQFTDLNLHKFCTVSSSAYNYTYVEPSR
jgi:hypothetical protein